MRFAGRGARPGPKNVEETREFWWASIFTLLNYSLTRESRLSRVKIFEKRTPSSKRGRGKKERNNEAGANFYIVQIASRNNIIKADKI